MVSALVWQLIKNHNSFLVKRGRTARDGAVQFSSEKGNLLNVNSAKYTGLATNASVHVGTDLTLAVKDAKNTNKPKTQLASHALTLHTGKGSKKIAEVVGATRPDLASTAALRFKKVANYVAIKKGLSKKVVKSTRRHKL